MSAAAKIAAPRVPTCTSHKPSQPKIKSVVTVASRGTTHAHHLASGAETKIKDSVIGQSFRLLTSFQISWVGLLVVKMFPGQNTGRE
jgi:hypothetical protein